MHKLHPISRFFVQFTPSSPFEESKVCSRGAALSRFKAAACVLVQGQTGAKTGAPTRDRGRQRADERTGRLP